MISIWHSYLATNSQIYFHEVRKTLLSFQFHSLPSHIASLTQKDYKPDPQYLIQNQHIFELLRSPHLSMTLLFQYRDIYRAILTVIPPPPYENSWQELFTSDLSNAIFPERFWSNENDEFIASEDQFSWAKGGGE